MAAAGSQPPEVVGFILNKVQEDLARLKDEVNRSVGSGGAVDALAVKAALENTQKELQQHAETTLQLIQDKTATLPHIVPPVSRSRGTGGSSKRSLGDVVHSYKSVSRLQRSTSESGVRTAPKPSPGDVVKAAYTRKLLSHPHNPASKEFICSRYGIPLASPRSLPAPVYRELEVEVVGNKPVIGPTVNQLAAVPHSKRLGNTLSPPPIHEEDARKGLLSLMERGLIPCNADILLSPSPVKPKPAILHSASQQFLKVEVADNSELKHFPLAHLDMRDPDDLSTSHASNHMRHTKGITGKQSTKEGQKVTAGPVPPPPVVNCPTDKGGNSPRAPTLHDTLPRMYSLLAPPPTRSPGALTVGSVPFLSADGSECHITMHRGALAEDDTDYVEFQRANQSEWGGVVSMLEECRRLACSFAVPLMVVNGAKLLELAHSYGMETKPTPQELISCLVNADEVESIVSTPGRRYRGVGGVQIAVAKIQATFRMYRARKEYLEYRRRKWAGGVIAMGWLLHLKARKMRMRLKERRAEERASFFRHGQELKKTWSRIKSERHVVVHLPSLGYPKDIRSQMGKLKIQENAQIARVCDHSSPNTEVIYVSPVVLSDDLESYNRKLLSLGQEGPQPEDTSRRLTFITPESLGKFGGHSLSLATVLLHSPKAMRRIRNLTRGKSAYIVPSVVSQDDLAVADQLGLPILGTDPNTVQLYSSRKAGAIKLFAEAEVATPPTRLDVFSEPQLVNQLASLIANHLEVQRWCFKLNNSVHARGIAYCDVAPHLSCLPWLRKEREWYGKKWNSKWAQEMAVKKIAEELADLLGQHTVMVDPAHFPTWRDFLAEMRIRGGLIQACPPSESVTALTVSILIEPDGAVQMLNAGDQIHPAPFQNWGVSVPQTSVDPTTLSSVVGSVAAACQDRGVCGHVSLDFVTFIAPSTMEQELWAVDLDIGMSDMHSMCGLLREVTSGGYCWKEGLFALPGQAQGMGEELTRYAVMSTQLLHESLSLIHSSVFFHLCRAHLIGYNVKDKEGCVFTLQDDRDRSNFGMMCVHPTLFGALTTMAKALSVIHQEVAMSTGTHTNFEEVTKELRRVATEVNDADTPSAPDL